MTEIFENIKKLYLFKSPCIELEPYIEFFSETSLAATKAYIQSSVFTVKLFPSYTPTIWINLGTPYHLKNGANWKKIDEYTDVLVLRNEIIERRNLPTDNIFTIKFFPGALEAIFGISQTEIGSEIIDVSQIIPSHLIKRLKNQSSIEDRIVLLEHFFLHKLYSNDKNSYYLNCIQQTIDAFNQSGLILKNKELVQNLAFSNKSMYRYFTKTIGSSPKNYLMLTRARIALTAYVNDIDSFSPYEYGYFDRSHFYKDMIKFTGKKLSANKL